MNRDLRFRFGELLGCGTEGTSFATDAQHTAEYGQPNPPQYAGMGFPQTRGAQPLSSQPRRTNRMPQSQTISSQPPQVIQLGGSSRKQIKSAMHKGDSPQQKMQLDSRTAASKAPQDESSMVGLPTHSDLLLRTSRKNQSTLLQELPLQPGSLTNTEFEVVSWEERILSKMVKHISRLRKLALQQAFKITKHHSESANRMVLMFTNHCATMIQKHFRRYITQKYYRHYRRCMLRMKELFGAMSMGWKVRRIMKTRTITKMVEDIKKKEQEKRLRDMRIQKRVFVAQVAKLLKNAKWLEEYRAARSNLHKSSNFRFLKTATVSQLDRKVVVEKLPLQPKPSLNEDVPLPTHSNTNRAPLIDHDEVPIKTVGGGKYLLEEGGLIEAEQLPIRSTTQKTEKSIPKKPAPKKKVIKLSSAQLDSQKPAAPSTINDASLKEPQIGGGFFYPVASLPQAKISGDTDPLDMTEKWPDDAFNATQKGITEPEEDKQEDERKQFLKRRTKYDPRKAIEEEKRRKLQPTKQQSKERAQLPQSKERSKSTDKTVLRKTQGQTSVVGVRSKPQRSEHESKELNVTLKRFVPSGRIQPPHMVSASMRSPTNQPPRQKHIPLEELEATYEAAYLAKKHSFMALCEKFARKSRKISYPIPTVRQVSDIYRRFSLTAFQGTETLLQQQFRCMLNM